MHYKRNDPAITLSQVKRLNPNFSLTITGVFIMVAAGIGAGIVIIILEILYHKHRGWKEEQKELAKKTTDKWRANIMLMKRDRSNNQPNGVNNTENNDGVGISRRNPIYSPENVPTETAFTYS